MGILRALFGRRVYEDEQNIGANLERVVDIVHKYRGGTSSPLIEVAERHLREHRADIGKPVR